MLADVVELVLLNEIYLLIGVGVAALVGVVDARPATWWRLPGAYLLGVAVAALLASYASLAGIAIGWLSLLLIAVVALALGLVRARRTAARVLDEPLASSSTWIVDRLVGAGLLVVAAVVLVAGSRTQAVRPPVEWDAWAVWALKARVLFEAPDAAPAVLRDSDYGPPSYPLVFPTLQALGYRAMGAFDMTLIGVQLLFLAAGFVGAVWAFLRERTSPTLLSLAILAAISAPQFLFQLSTKYADVPLAIFVGAGLAAAARWIVSDTDEPWALGCAVLLLGAAGLTKNEGLLFAAAAALALLVAAAMRGRGRLLHAVLASAALAAVVLPWRIYARVHDLATQDYDLGNLFDPGYLADQSARVHPAATELWSQMNTVDNWGFLVPLIVLSLAVGLLSGNLAGSAFAGIWLTLAFGGLLATYWISVLPLESNLTNSSNRTIVSILVGGAALIPAVLGRAAIGASDALGALLSRRALLRREQDAY